MPGPAAPRARRAHIVRAALSVLVIGFFILCSVSPEFLLSDRRRDDGPRLRLNVLFIIADDMSAKLGCYGDPDIKSPNIDRLARRGTLFEHAYCQYALCNPSRTSFLSGRRPESTGVLANSTPPRTHLKDIDFLPEYFHRFGYYTLRVGKVAHHVFDQDLAWDFAEDPSPGQKADSRGARRRQQQDDREENDRGLPAVEATDYGDEGEPDGIAARSVASLLEQNRDKQFFLAVGFERPHRPFVAPKKYFDLYPADNIELPNETINDGIPDGMKRAIIAGYDACISFVDAQVGVIIDALDRLGLKDKTVIVFTSDHGLHVGEHDRFGKKQTLYETTARVPLIVAAPGKPSAASRRLVELVDLYPTLLDLCRLPHPVGLEGLSFAPLLDRSDLPWKEAAFTTLYRQGVLRQSVRTERYRYSEAAGDRHDELYDHFKDPHEYYNRAGDFNYWASRLILTELLRGGWQGVRAEMLRRPDKQFYRIGTNASANSLVELR